MNWGVHLRITRFFGLDAGFQWKDSKGAPIGPFAVIVYDPRLGFIRPS